MGVLLIGSILATATIAQASPQEISLSIQKNSLNLNSDILIAECKSRRIQPVSPESKSGFQVTIRESRPGILEVAITDLDGETSLRELNIDGRSNQAKASLEREIALIIESVIRRWERKQQVKKAAAPNPPSQAPPPAEQQAMAEPERRAASPRPDVTLSSTGIFEQLWSSPKLELGFGGSAGLSRDAQGSLLGLGTSLRVRFGGRLKVGASGHFNFSDIQTNTPLVVKKGDFSEWSTAVHLAVVPLETLPTWLVSLDLGVGEQTLVASEGFNADGLFSVLSLGTEWQQSLLTIETNTLSLTVGAYGDWTWIGPSFTWEPELVAYRPARLKLRGELGLAWQF